MKTSILSPRVRHLLLLGGVLGLSACGGSGTSNSHYDMSKLEGSYATAYTDTEGQPHLARAVLVSTDNLTLTLFDAEDRVSNYAGSLNQSNDSVSFGDLGQCQKSGADLSCTLNGQTLQLSTEQGAQATPELANLAGDYHLSMDQSVETISLTASGDFSLSHQGCKLKGQLNTLTFAQSTELPAATLALDITSAECGYSLSKGYLQLESLAPNTMALAVYLPDSVLAGYWLR